MMEDLYHRFLVQLALSVLFDLLKHVIQYLPVNTTETIVLVLEIDFNQVVDGHLIKFRYIQG